MMPYEGRYRRTRRDRESETVRRTELGRFLDNHVRLIAALATVLVLLVLFLAFELIFNGEAIFGGGKDKGEPMSVGFLVALDDKTSPITFRDLEGKRYETISESKYDEGTYVLRRYEVEGGELSLTVGGYIKGSAATGNVAYATLTHQGETEFKFSLLEEDGLIRYLGKYGITESGVTDTK